MPEHDSITRLSQLEPDALRSLMNRYGLELVELAAMAPIPASFWGEPEAGLAGRCLFVRPDTPVHSLLHEACHYICMTNDRRVALWRDAGGNDDEEAAVCYLQILLADSLAGLDRDTLFQDLDEWGYTFREGSARDWFEGDGKAARTWLQAHALVDETGAPTWRVRE